ncbi:hypothetical protein GQ54DRAFT_265969 [Martensiomyces pterosporus]|nr:hypothetical protein GQ54DRAFT_265969 [Martensiomyces pterosporus]
MEFKAKIERLQQKSRETYRHDPWELPVIYVQPGELSAAEFSRLWRNGTVVVVRGLLGALDAEIWKPRWWIKNFGYEMVSILDSAQAEQSVGEWPLRDFYRLFDGADNYSELFNDSSMEKDEWETHRRCLRDGVMKLKDWPPAEDFQARLPDHFQRFMDALPFSEYTHREGKFNLVNRLPAEFVPPDLGPKMYCAYGSSDSEGGVGTTNLHCDMADAVNIMAYASKDFLRKNGIELAAAVWDIYPPEALKNLREYIYSLDGIAGSLDPSYGDAIHNQATFLTRPHRKQLYDAYGDAGGRCYRVYQNPGDAVFVPAGCAHQVCNYASAVKVAMDFVSPERVDQCKQMTDEFRQLQPSHQRNKDLLQLNNILWWTVAGRQQHKPAAASTSKAVRGKGKSKSKQSINGD